MKKPALLGVAGLIVLVVGILAITLIVQRDESEQIRSLSRLADAGDMERAQAELRAIDPTSVANFETLVNATNLSARVDRGQTARYLRAALAHENRSSAGLAELTNTAISVDEVDLARSLLEEALRLDPVNARAFLAAARYNHFTGNHREAILFFENAFNRIEPERRDELNFAESLALSGDVSKIIRAKDILMRLSEGTDAVAIAAFIVLGTYTHIPLLEAETLPFLARFRQHPLLGEALGNEPELMRRLIARFEDLDGRFAFKVGETLMASGEATSRDRKAFAFIALKQGETEAAERALRAFDGLDRETADFQSLEAYLKMQQGRTAAGVEQILSARETHPSSPEILMVAEAILFIQPPDLVLSEREEIARLIMDHPLASSGLILRGYSLLIEIRPLRADALLAEVVERFRATDPELLASWLQGRNAFETILRITDPPPDSGDRQVLLGFRLDALLSLGRFDTLRDELQIHGETISRALRKILDAEIAFHEGDPAAAWRAWELAFERGAFTRQAMSLRRLAAIAARERDRERAYRAYMRLFANDQGNLSSEEYSLFLSLAMEQDDLSIGTRIARTAAELFPTPANQNNAAYLNALSGEQLEDALETMREVTRDNPGQANFKLTYAFALLRSGQPQEALRVAETVQIDMTPAGAQNQAIYAAILAANNRGALAAGIAANIDKSRLFPAERRLVEDLGR